MVTASKEKIPVKEFEILYPLRDYTFPKEALIDKVRCDETYIHVTLLDGRILSIPLEWIPTLSHAKPEEREKYQINQTRRMIIWDPAVCEINEDIRIDDFLGPIKSVDYSVGGEPIRVIRGKKVELQEKEINEMAFSQRTPFF
jgi:hypothetical protein